MKYKVGDKVRLENGVVCTILSYYAELGCQFPDAFKCKGEVNGNDIAPVRLKSISHLIISEITDELINRFKEEKIAWHFKNKEDYSKMLYLLSNKGIGFHFAVESPEEFFDKKKDFCLNLYSLKLHLQYGGLDNHIKDGYEIIEIMNPVYVPKKLVIDEVNGDIKVHGYSLKIINDIFYADGLRLEYQDGKLCYKGIDCELLFQQYMQQKKIPDLEKKVENQKVEIKNLHNMIDEMRRTLAYEMSYSKTLAKENCELKKQMKILLDDVNFYKGRISVAREILDYED